jgi:hypothetical protein
MAIRLALERQCDLRGERWYSGDTGCYFLTPHAALLEGAGEGLAVVNLLALEYRRKGPAVIPNLVAFSGQQPALQDAECLVVVNTLNQHAALGNVGLLNSHRIVFPLCTGSPGPDDWTIADWCDQCHRKGGLVVWNRKPGAALLDGEPPADLILGKVDALELHADEVPSWYTLLDAGFCVPLCGTGGKMSNRQLLGGCRTYAQLAAGEEFSYKNWVEAVRGGRTFVTQGPLLLLTVNEEDPGATLEVEGAEAKVRVRVEVKNPEPGGRIEVVRNGAVVAERSWSEAGPAVLEAEISVGDGGWLASRHVGAGGPKPSAHTSAVYLKVASRPPRVDLQAVDELLRYTDRMLEWVAQQGRFETEKQREAQASVFRGAREVLMGRRGG